MIRAVLGLLLLLSVPASAVALLGDDFNRAVMPQRLMVGGDLLPTPPGPGKAFDGGQGWRSGMRIDPIEDRYYGRRDYVLYRHLQPGIDLPVENGRLDLWFQRNRSRDALPQADTLLAWLDHEGKVLAAIAVSYAEDGLPSALLMTGFEAISEDSLPIKEIPLGRWTKLSFLWGGQPGARSRILLDDRPLPFADKGGDFAEIQRSTVAVRIGLGWDDSDPAYRTLIDRFQFSVLDTADSKLN